LKQPPIDWPEDFEIDIAVNGQIIKTYNKTEFGVFRAEIAYNEAFYPLLDDKDFITGDEPEAVEIGMRVRSEENPYHAGLTITHIYYA